MLFPLWVWTAIAGLLVGMVIAWASKRAKARAPLLPQTLTLATVEEITALIEARKPVKAIKLLRISTGAGLVDAKNRIDDWRPEEEREAAR